MSDWTPELEKIVMDMARSGMSCAEIGRQMGMTRGKVLGKIARMKGPVNRERNYNADRARHTAARVEKIKRGKYVDRGGWDEKLFEPYAVRKVRMARERAHV